MSLQEDCRTNRWPARDTATTSLCVCTSHLKAGTPAEECLTQVWTDSIACCCGKEMFSVFMLDDGHLTDGLQTIPPVEKNTPVRVTEHLPEHPSHLSGCAYSCLQLPVTLYHWSHWHQCNSLVNACFSSGGDCKSLYKHSLTFDSEEKPKGSYDSKCESCPEHSVA